MQKVNKLKSKLNMLSCLIFFFGLAFLFCLILGALLFKLSLLCFGILFAIAAMLCINEHDSTESQLIQLTTY